MAPIKLPAQTQPTLGQYQVQTTVTEHAAMPAAKFYGVKLGVKPSKSQGLIHCTQYGLGSLSFKSAGAYIAFKA